MWPRKGITALRASIIIAIIIAAAAAGLYSTTRSGQVVKRETSYPLTFTDDLGRNVSITKRPEKILSLIPSLTQIVFAVGAGDRVVGATQYDDYPPELVERMKNGSVVSVGGGFSPDIEKITALNPDVILADGPSHLGSKPLKRLQELGFTVISLDPSSIEEVLESIQLVGKIVGNEEKAGQVVKSMREKIDSVVSATRNAPKVKVYVENWHDPLFSVGPGSVQHEMIEKAGGINVFSDLKKGSAQVNAEAVIERNPDIIISFGKQVSIEDIKMRPGWNQINAVKNGKIFKMDHPEGASNPRIADSLEKMAKLIHPGQFKAQQIVEQMPTSSYVILS